MSSIPDHLGLSQGVLGLPNPRYILLADWDIYKSLSTDPISFHWNSPWHENTPKERQDDQNRSHLYISATRRWDIEAHTYPNSIPTAHAHN